MLIYLESTHSVGAYFPIIIKSKLLVLGNGMASRNFAFLDNMRKLEKLVNRTKWSMTPPTVNAYYTPTKNQIVFPASKFDFG